MRQKPFTQRVGDFMEGKGFYIVLFLCVAAIGISGYFLFSGMLSKELSAQEGQQTMGQTQVEEPATTPTVPQVTTEPQAPVTPTTPPADAEPTEELEDQPTAFLWPVQGEILRDYSLEVFAYDETMGDWRTHTGMDFSIDQGAQVTAISDGTVASIEDDPLMGVTVVVDHGDGLTSVYANLSEGPTAVVGDAVTAGTVLGKVGQTALSETALPSHLHFEMRQDDVSIDPMQFLSR